MGENVQKLAAIRAASLTKVMPTEGVLNILSSPMSQEDAMQDAVKWVNQSISQLRAAPGGTYAAMDDEQIAGKILETIDLIEQRGGAL